MREWRWVTAALLLAVGGTAAWADEFAIQSFDGTGRLTFNELPKAEKYRVEWAPTPAGPWTNTWDSLAEITAHGSGIVTCSVPMCYRVIAELPPPPIGTVLIPGRTNVGTDPDFGTYSLTISSFYMDKYEVTKSQWDKVYTWAITNGYSFESAGSGKAANHPVHTVSWYDVVKWCNARSEKEGRPAVYTVNGAVYKTSAEDNVVQTSVAGYSLPTDVEWEYAARGGVANQRFPWGDTIQHAWANYCSDAYYSYDTSPTREYHPTYATGSEPYTSPVGAFAPNGYGLYDMVGNVWEWCFEGDPIWGGSNRIIRGGGWDSIAYYCRVGNRSFADPRHAAPDGGFRAVLRPGHQ